MLSDREYIRQSVEFNLFSLRIAKEHAIIAAASLPPAGLAVGNQLLSMKNNYEALLKAAVSLADGVISNEVLASGELVTEFTLNAEVKTQRLTGLPINTAITKKELALKPGKNQGDLDELLSEVSRLNKKALELTGSAIVFLEKLLDSAIKCQAFSFTYPSMLEHVTHESVFAAMMLEKFEERDGIDSIKEIIDQELTWNEIMGEHAKFIRGYLDPSEDRLFDTANGFARTFEQLMEKTRRLPKRPEQLARVTEESIRNVRKLRNFKVQGTQGILECKIKSVIIPLLSDHVTREANHYLRLLNMFDRMV